MKNFKKALSVVLSVVLVLGTISIVAFAHTSTWEEVPTTVNLKYEVEQVSSVTMSDGTGTYTAVDNDIYAVTVYAKTPALTGIMYLQVPFQYDVNYFEPIITMDEGDLYCAYDGWYTDIGLTDVCYSLPEHYSDTNAYDQNGAVQTSSMKIKCYGLGHASAGSIAVNTYYYGLDDPASTAMNAYAGLGDDIRLCAITLDNTSGVAKTAYFNAVNGLIPTDWVPMGTLYFHRVDGVSEADAVGQVIGIADGANFGTQLTTRTTTTAQPAGFLMAHVNPKYQANYVSNAVVEVKAPTGPAVAKSAAQLRMVPTSATTCSETEYSFRVISTITDADFDAYFSNSGNKTATTDCILECGMVGYKGASFDMDTAKAVAEGTETNAAYAVGTTDYVCKPSDTADATFGAIIVPGEKADVTYVGFVKYADASGNTQYAYYETEEVAPIATNWTSLVSAWFTAYPYAG